MRRLISLAAFWVATCIQATEGALSTAADVSNTRKFVAGQVLVGLEVPQGVPKPALVAAAQQLQVSGLRYVKSIRHTVLLNITDGTPVRHKVAALNLQPDVMFAEPNYLRIAAQLRDGSIPNDPNYIDQWSMPTIFAPTAWSRFTGSTSVKVCVVDTGVDYNHEDLKANVDSIHRFNGIKCSAVSAQSQCNNDPMDNNGHGTHCSGIVGATGNNSKGIAGVNWQVTIVPCKFLDSTGQGNVFDESWCFDQCIKSRVDIISASYTSDTFSNIEYQALQRVQSAGILFVAAAGNMWGNDNDMWPTYPASYDLSNIVSVAASDEYDNLAYFSNYGSTTVDLAAPGVNILSTFPNNQYKYLSGTSMATPMVAGAAALLLGASGDKLTANNLKTLLMQTVDTPESLSDNGEPTVTNGRLNLAAAMSQLPSPSPLPSPATTSSPSPPPRTSPNPSRIPVASSSAIPSRSPSRSPSTTPSRSPSASPSPTLTASPSASLPHSPSANPPRSPSASPSASPLITQSRSPSANPSSSPSASPSRSLSRSPSASPAHSPSASPLITQSRSPSASPSSSPSASPSRSLSRSPSASPSASPARSPSASPLITQSHSPSASPTSSPSAGPSRSLSQSPSASPAHSPSASPLVTQSRSPSAGPSSSPSASPSKSLSRSPSASPAHSPSASPSITPSRSPSASPSSSPSASPSRSLSRSPSASPLPSQSSG